MIKLIRPKLEYQRSLALKVEKIDALQDIKMQESDLSFLDPDYADVLKHSDRIQQEFKLMPKALQTLHGIITDLYVDIHKFRARDVSQQQMGQLIQILGSNASAQEILQSALTYMTDGM